MGMTDYPASADHGSQVPPAAHRTPDYELADELALTDPAEYRALFEETRTAIVMLLLERAATTSELAETLDRPKGTIGHHLKVLEEAGLVRVVRTEQRRALTAKYYGRTARVFLFEHAHDAIGEPQRILTRAAAEISVAPQQGPISANIRYARIPQERAGEWLRRLNELLVEFATEQPDGDVTWALTFGLYPTTRRPLAHGAGSRDAHGHDR